MKRTISGMIGTGSLAHNRRDFIAENVDPDRVQLNICYQNENLKEVYKAPTEEFALAQLDKLKETWGNSYGMVIDSWYNNWNNLSTFFDFSPRIRKMIYTTNALEGFNRQVRKYTKSRTIFPTDESLNKCVYLATMEIMEKWTQPVPNWGATLAELTLFFTEELKDELA